MRKTRKLIGRFIPRTVRAIIDSVRNYRILSSDLGQFISIKKNMSIEKNATPIPFFTYPAIEFIKQLDLSGKTVCEYGSGNSTLFFAEKARKVVSIENCKAWYELMQKKLPENVKYELYEIDDDMIKAISNYENDFDIIIIDGYQRFEVAKQAVKQLKSDGFIILDNSEWYVKAAKYLREAGFIELDMAGFVPMMAGIRTTSFFLSRNINFKYSSDRAPLPGVGGVIKDYE